MKYLRGFFALLMLSISFIGTSIYLESQSFDTPRSYVHLIYHENGGSGSAVVIAPGLVLTAAHVADQENLLINGLPTRTLKINHEIDLALIQASVDCPCAPLGENPDLGDRVVAVGWSLGEMEFATTGTVQGWSPVRIWTDSNIVFGNSGGGLFAFQDGKWKLVGSTIQVPGVNVGFFGIPVFHMVHSVDIITIRKFVDLS